MTTEPYDPEKDPHGDDPHGYKLKPFERPGPSSGEGYHGTSRGLVGTQIRPDIGREKPAFDFSGKRHINFWSSPSGERKDEAEKEAWGWAHTPYGHTAPEGDESWGRARVHEVRAAGPIGRDWNLGGRDEGAPKADYSKIGQPIPTASTHADVTNTIWIPPPSEEAKRAGRGVQGTLEHMNWNQFGLPNAQAAQPQDIHYNATIGTPEVMEADRKMRVNADLDATAERNKRLAPSQPQEQIPGQLTMHAEGEVGGWTAEDYRNSQKRDYEAQVLQTKRAKREAASTTEPQLDLSRNPDIV